MFLYIAKKKKDFKNELRSLYWQPQPGKMYTDNLEWWDRIYKEQLEWPLYIQVWEIKTILPEKAGTLASWFLFEDCVKAFTFLKISNAHFDFPLLW